MSIVASELTSLLVADTVTGTGVGGGYPATPTQVNGVNVSSTIECQSTTRAFLLPRMTTVQRDAIAVPFNGMMIYNTTDNEINSYENGAWGAAGAGDVDGPGASTNDAIAVFNGVTGKIIQNTAVLLNPVTGIISAIGGLINAAGTAAAPSLSFTGDTNTGIYSSGADTIDFATNGVRQFEVTGSATSVNYLAVTGSATGAPLAVTALGTDGTIGIALVPKNNGPVFVNGGSVGNPGLAFNGGGISTTSGLSLNVGGVARTNWVSTSVSGAAMSAINGNAVISMGTTTFDATMTNGIQLATGTAPTGQANTLQIFGATIGGNAGTLGLQIPVGAVSVSADNTVNFKVQVNVNGTTMYLLASNAP